MPLTAKKIPKALVCFLRRDGQRVFRKIPDSTIPRWQEWELIPSHQTADDYIAACKEIGIEVRWIKPL